MLYDKSLAACMDGVGSSVDKQLRVKPDATMSESAILIVVTLSQQSFGFQHGPQWWCCCEKA